MQYHRWPPLISVAVFSCGLRSRQIDCRECWWIYSDFDWQHHDGPSATVGCTRFERSLLFHFCVLAAFWRFEASCRQAAGYPCVYWLTANGISCAASKQKLIARGNTFCANMAKRGGGVRDIEAFIRQPRESDRKIGGSPFVVVHIQVTSECGMTMCSNGSLVPVLVTG